MQLAKLGSVPAIVLILAIVLAFVFNAAQVYVFNAPDLLLIMNVLFITGTGIAVAVISAKSYLDYGMLNVLVFGIAVLIMGLGAVLAGWASEFSVNANVTIYNVALLMFSGVQVLGAVLTSTGLGANVSRHRKITVAAAYVVAVSFISAMSVLAVSGFLPIFFTQDGGTILRDVVLESAIFFSVLALLTLGWIYVRLRSRTLLWYCLALAMVTTGLTSSLFVVEFGGILAWLTRFTQYAAGFYFLFALLQLRTGMEPTAGFSERWTEAFRRDKTIDALFANMNEGLSYNKIVLDSDGMPVNYVTLEINDTFKRIFGVGKELLGKSATEFYGASEKGLVERIAAYGKVASSGEPVKFEFYSDRFQKWLAESAYSVEKGYFAVISRDVSKRKKAEEELRETRNYLENLLNYANAPIIVWDPNFKITMFNHAFEHLTGVSATDAVGKELAILFPKDEKAEAMAHIRDALAGERWESVEIPILHLDGTVKTALWNSANIYDDTGKEIVATIAQGQDITERKRILEDLEKSTVQLAKYASQMEELAEQRARQLEDAERLATIGQTAGMVGHDIRNPLQAITGDVYLAKSDLSSLPDGKLKESMQESLEAIEKNADYINKIVADLQDFAKPLNPVFEETDLKGLVNQVLAEQDIPDNVQAYSHVKAAARKITADPAYLKRILDNLVSNAVQAMPKGGELSIEAFVDDEDAILSIADTGSGIPEKIKPKLFQPLFTTKSKGQGFGLAVCKRLVEVQGGTIGFESQEGKGTKFIVRIPQKPQERQAHTNIAKN